jgi:hypothetical protein
MTAKVSRQGREEKVMEAQEKWLKNEGGESGEGKGECTITRQNGKRGRRWDSH